MLIPFRQFEDITRLAQGLHSSATGFFNIANETVIHPTAGTITIEAKKVLPLVV
jgi:hypothetical protein